MSRHDLTAFIADYGFTRLQGELFRDAEAWLQDVYEYPVPLELTAEGMFVRPRGRVGKSRTVAGLNPQNLTYSAQEGEANGLPRLNLTVNNHGSGPWATESYPGWQRVVEVRFHDWLEQQQAFTPRERAAWEARKAARQQAEAKRRKARARAAAARRAAEQREQAEIARKLEAQISRWHQLPEATDHPYLTAKKLGGRAWPDVRLDAQRNRLTIAIRDVLNSKIVGLQHIYPNGKKLFEKGGRKKSAAIFLSGPPPRSCRAARIAEGWATAATTMLALEDHAGPTVFVAALDAGNLLPVAEALKQRCPKARITFDTDDDAATALQPNLENVGQIKAHGAALKLAAKLTRPALPGRADRNVDYSDVYLQLGLTAVRTQLADTTYFAARHAFAAELREQRAHLERCHASGGSRNLPQLGELSNGVTTIRAPHGSGKTEGLRQLVAQTRAAGGRVLYLTHRVTLADDAARRLGLEVYSDQLLRDHLHLTPGLACTVNSLHKLTDREGTAAHFDLVIIDESEQFVRALAGRHIANKHTNLKALAAVCQSAAKLVVLDADLGSLTHLLLEQFRPSERAHTVTHFFPVGEGREIQIHERRDDLYAALGRFTEPVMVVTNSKHESEAVHAHLTLLGKHGRLINADTSAEESALLADLDAGSRSLDYLVCSPSVSTGVSLTTGHFRHVVGLFYASVGVPEDALQALWRVRTHVTYDVWLDPRRTHERIDVDAKHGVTQEHETQLLGRRFGYELGFYRKLLQEAERQEQQQRSNYRLNFMRLAALQGFELKLVSYDEEHAGLAARARELADEQFRQAVAAARLLTGEEAAQLSRKVLLTQDERRELERHRVVEFYHLARHESLTPWLELDHRGRYRKQLARLELALGDDARTHSVVSELAEQHDMRADLPELASHRVFHRQVLDAVGFGKAAELVLAGQATQLDLPRYDAAQLEPLRRWVEGARSWLSGLIALPEPEKLKVNLIRYVGSWLKKLGLKHTRTGKNERGVYSLTLEVLETACSTLKRRGTVSLENKHLRKSVPAAASPPECAASWLEQLLSTGLLEPIGERRLKRIRDMLAENDHAWLDQLAVTSALRQLAGAA